MLENNENNVIYTIRQAFFKCWFFKPTFIYANSHSAAGRDRSNMDARQVFEVINEATFNMDNSTCDELVGLLNYMEYVVPEDKKTELFKKRINYICLANSFQAAMERDYKMKQMSFFEEALEL